MSITVTATPAGATGALLRVLVLTGATEAGGAAAQPATSGPGTVSITPNGSDSRIIWSGNDFFGASPWTGAADNTVLDNVAASGQEMASGYFTGTVIAGTAVTAGGTTSDSGSNGNLICAYEVPASGGSTPALDASAPAAVSESSGSAALTTDSFSPPAGAVLAAVLSGAAFPAGWQVTDSSGLVWTKRADNTNGQQIWTATVPAPASGGGHTVPIIQQEVSMHALYVIVIPGEEEWDYWE